ncbi:MAG: stage V sporulation protein B [Clostridiales bacterium]|nr:stage V sporulation protein B [Clostridiales bacterium]
MKINTRSMLFGTLILAGANMLVRAMGFIYQIILSRLLGPEGIGIYQLVIPPYSIALALTTSGIPVAVSRLVAAKNATGHQKQSKEFVITAIGIVSTLGILLSLLMIISSDWISHRLLKDPRTRIPLLILFPCVIITSISAVFKGYFYGTKNTLKPALAEIIEQILRITLAVFLLFRLSPADYEKATIFIVLGIVMGELASLLYLHTNYYHKTKNLINGSATTSIMSRISMITNIALPITLTRLMITAINSVNTILIPQRLMASGITNSQAVSLFGIVSGMVLPLLYMPFTITNALYTVIIPHLSEDLATSNWSAIRANISRAIRLTTIFAFPASALLLSLGHPIGIALYNQTLVGQFLTPLTWCMIFHALQHTLSAILNGLGKQKLAASYAAMGGIIQIICTYFLAAQPDLRIYGFIIGFNLRSIITFLLSFTKVAKLTKIQIKWKEWFIKPGFAAVFAASFSRCAHNLLNIHSTMPSAASLILSLGIGGMSYLTVLYCINGIPPIKAKRLP